MNAKTNKGPPTFTSNAVEAVTDHRAWNSAQCCFITFQAIESEILRITAFVGALSARFPNYKP